MWREVTGDLDRLLQEDGRENGHEDAGEPAAAFRVFKEDGVEENEEPADRHASQRKSPGQPTRPVGKRGRRFQRAHF